MNLIRFNTKQVDPLKEFFDYENSFWGFPLKNTLREGGRDNWVPALEVKSDENNVYVKADLPGLKKEDISVTIDDNILTVKGERKFEKEEKNKQYHLTERSYGVFERSLSLGTNVDASRIKANYKDGVLDITIPKSEKTKAKQIAVEG